MSDKLDIPQSLMDGLDIVAKSANDSLLLHKVCRNKNVTLDIVQLLFKVNPAAAYTATGKFAWEECEGSAWDHINDSTAYPLHLACYNEHCPSSVIQHLLVLYPDATKHFCALDKWKPHPEFHELELYGLPLSYYLSRTVNVDIETVKLLVGAYPLALLDTNGDDEHDTTAGYLPIHTLLNNPNVSQMTDIGQYLVREFNSIRKSAGYGNHPLHIACANKNMMQRLFKCYLKHLT